MAGIKKTIIEEIPMASMARVANSMTKEMSFDMLTVMKMLGGYQMSTHNIVDLIDGTGKCLICGKVTNSEDRCICFECHGKYIEDIYNDMKNKLKNGEVNPTITISI